MTPFTDGLIALISFHPADVVAWQGAMAAVLEGGRHLSRPELGVALEREGIGTKAPFRLTYLAVARYGAFLGLRVEVVEIGGT